VLALKPNTQQVLDLIKMWLETESGPTAAKFSIADLHLTISIKGYKKLILERTFPQVTD
jgi:hypothetical protein